MKTYKAHFSGDEEWINVSSASEVSIVHLSDNQYHLIRGGRSYRMEVLDFDPITKEMIIKANGSRYQFALKDQHDDLINKMGLKAGEQVFSGEVYSPMPGLILDVMVSQGDEIQEGDAICILEAMKMENVLKSEGAGTITKIHVAKGDAVDKGQLLIEVV